MTSSGERATVRRVAGPEWMGNGFGTAPGTYALVVGGRRVATIGHNGGGASAWGVYAGAPTMKNARVVGYGERVSPTGWMTYREARAWALEHAAELAAAPAATP